MPESNLPARLNLGCGDDVKDGYLNVDAFPSGPRVQRMDFTRVPWELPDEQFDEVYARHVIEHVPPIFLEDRHGVRVDVLPRIVEEVWRVLRPAGRFVVHTPLGTSRLGPSHWQHYRLVTPEWFELWNQRHPAARPFRYHFELETLTLHAWRARGDRWFKIRGLGLTLHLAIRFRVFRALLATHVEMRAVLRKLPMPARPAP